MIVGDMNTRWQGRKVFEEHQRDGACWTTSWTPEGQLDRINIWSRTCSRQKLKRRKGQTKTHDWFQTRIPELKDLVGSIEGRQRESYKWPICPHVEGRRQCLKECGRRVMYVGGLYESQGALREELRNIKALWTEIVWLYEGLNP